MTISLYLLILLVHVGFIFYMQCLLLICGGTFEDKFSLRKKLDVY